MTATRTGAGMALVSMFCVQLGIAASVGLFDEVGSDGAACLRLAFAGLILLAIVRPRPGAFSRSSLAAAIALGAVTAAMTMCFMAAVDRIPMGTASALEFLGPLGVAILRGRDGTKVWPAVAAIGVLLLTEPWRGALDPAGVAFALAAAVAWALVHRPHPAGRRRGRGPAGPRDLDAGRWSDRDRRRRPVAGGRPDARGAPGRGRSGDPAAGHPVRARDARAATPDRDGVRDADEPRAGARAADRPHRPGPGARAAAGRRDRLRRRRRDRRGADRRSPGPAGA